MNNSHSASSTVMNAETGTATRMLASDGRLECGFIMSFNVELHL